MGLNEEFNLLWDEFLKTCRAEKVTNADGSSYIMVKDQMAYDVISFIQRQLNPIARKGYMNEAQYVKFASDACEELSTMIYVNHFDEYGDPLDVDPLYISGANLIFLLASRALGGRDRQLELAEIAAKQQINMVRA